MVRRWSGTSKGSARAARSEPLAVPVRLAPDVATPPQGDHIGCASAPTKCRTALVPFLQRVARPARNGRAAGPASGVSGHASEGDMQRAISSVIATILIAIVIQLTPALMPLTSA